MKNPTDPIGNRIHDLPSGSAVPQPTAPPFAPHFEYLIAHHDIVWINFCIHKMHVRKLCASSVTELRRVPQLLSFSTYHN